MLELILAVFVLTFQANSAPIAIEKTTEHRYTDSDFGCEPGEFACSKCFDVLQNEVLISSKNRYNLQRAFYPPDTASPVLVSVTYYLDNMYTYNLYRGICTSGAFINQYSVNSVHN